MRHGMSSKLRQLISNRELLVAPGVYDGITARLVEQNGHGAAYMTGAGTAAAHGYPDFGLLTLSEMAANAAIIARSVDIPVIADADTGFGNELNVTRAVREYERAGVAGLHLEGKEVVELDEFIAKIRAAVAARDNPDFVIIARTDARAVHGFDEAIRRANAALRNGADVAFVEAVETHEEIANVPQFVNGPCLLNIVRSGKTPDVDLKTVQELGYAVTILPSLLLVAGIDACLAVLSDLVQTGRPPRSDGAMPIRERFRRFGADDWEKLRTRFRTPSENWEEGTAAE